MTNFLHWVGRLASALTALALINVATTHAQKPAHQLRGLTELKLRIEILDKDATTCGINDSLVRNAFMYPARGAGLNVVTEPSAGAPVFHINIITTRDRDLCVSSVQVRVYNYQRVKLEYQEYETFAEVTLWTAGLVAFADQRRHGNQIKSAVKDMTKNFVTVWNLSNKQQQSAPPVK